MNYGYTPTAWIHLRNVEKHKEDILGVGFGLTVKAPASHIGIIWVRFLAPAPDNADLGGTVVGPSAGLLPSMWEIWPALLAPVQPSPSSPGT